jgi:50S ribosomal protein L16 3-hydroxylase
MIAWRLSQNLLMDIVRPATFLAGLSPTQFMRSHWQRKPLLVRQAFPGLRPPASRARLFELAASPDVESRLVQGQGRDWRVRSGPLPRRALPPVVRPNWTLLVQGLDLHEAAAREMLRPFRFIPDARLDDLMMSWASDGGGVGPHLDSYDVFLIQVQGRRRWQIGRPADNAFVEGLPLKILQHFEPEQEWVLDPGDMLYLPPRWAHDGVALGECMTCSVGFRAPPRGALARELLQRLADDDEGGSGGAVDALYRDAGELATDRPGAIPQRLQDFARQAVERALSQPDALARSLGEVLTEPKPRVWFRAHASGDIVVARHHGGVVLAPGSRMLYDERHVFFNGESYRASGRDARLMRHLADHGSLGAQACARLGPAAQELLHIWLEDGWLLQEDER